MEERYYLVFPGSFIILAVGQSLSGYELKVGGRVMKAIAIKV